MDEHETGRLPENMVAARLEAILEGSYDGVYITDGNAVTVKVNSSYEKITGLRREDVLGKDMRELVSSGLISSSGTLLALERRETVTIEQKFRTGKRALVTSTPAFDDAGNIVMVVTNVRDITTVYNLRRRLERNEDLARRQLSEIEVIRRQIIGSGAMVVEDETMRKTMLMAAKVARMDTVVLLAGETGVGKEMVATYIHQESPRRNENLIKVNCGAIPGNLVESELFGFEKGSFTGADKDGKPGLFEVADRGTIFLDEVGELSLDVQVALLRVLQEKEVRRIGAKKPCRIDVRILAATNRDLEEMIAQKRFRKDLFYRLNVFPITIPPLRRRPMDILPLADSMLCELNRKYGMAKALTPAAARGLKAYDWPGNVRELRNVLERALILSNDDTITPDELSIPPVPDSMPAETVHQAGQTVNLKKILEGIEAGYVNAAYKEHQNLRKAARSLSMDAATYLRKRRKYQPHAEDGLLFQK